MTYQKHSHKLNEKQLIYAAGDTVGLVGEDVKRAGTDLGNFLTNILTLNKRWFCHGSADVVVECELKI